jgi:peptidylprolyl isomerase
MLRWIVTSLTWNAILSWSGLSGNPPRREVMIQSLGWMASALGSGSIVFLGPTPVMAEEVEIDMEDPYRDYITTESGLKYKVVQEGSGAIPNPGDNVKAHYTGWLQSFDNPTFKFDSSRDRNRPFTFRVGAGQVIRGQVIRGWDQAFSTMRVGERRRIILPPRLGYGDRGAGGIIPGGATLYFDVELLGIL